MTIVNASNAPLASYSAGAALGGGFAGFVTDGAVARIVIGGNVGDGYDHADDFETAFDLFTPVPALASGALLLIGAAGLAAWRRFGRL